jgi:hypothetical protein
MPKNHANSADLSADVLMGPAYAPSVTRDASRLRALRTVPEIFANEQSADDADHTIANGGTLDRQMLVSSNDSFQMPDIERYSHAVGIMGQTIGAVGAVLFPEIALPLALAGIWSEDAWKAVTSGRDLTQNPFLPDDTPQAQVTAQAVIDAAALQRNTSDTFEGVLQTSSLAQQTGINFQASAPELVRQFPADQQATVELVIATQQGSSDKGSALIDALTQQTTALHAQVDELRRIQQQEQDQAKRQAASVQMAYLREEVLSGIQVCTFLFGRVTGDRAKAAEIGQVATGLVNVYFAAATGQWMGAISAGLL